MSTIQPHIIFLSGLAIITVGAELLLRGASLLAILLGVRPLIIGLTVVSIGTSAPELAVGIAAVLEGRGPLAIGNIAGTNIFNILFILGLSAMIRPLPIRLSSLRLDVPVMIAAAVALFVMAWDGTLSRVEGVIMIGAAVIYTITLIHFSRNESLRRQKEYAEEYGAEAVLSPSSMESPHRRMWKGLWSLLMFIAGLLLTLLGADWMVAGASSIARMYGVSDAVIGLTIVAVGTSAPELVTTLLATLKNDREVAIGNLIGSSIYNVLVILGVTCAVSPEGVDVSKEILRIDLPLAAAVALVCYPVFKSDRLVSRREGAIFVLAYMSYLVSLLFIRT